jgi:hypothetical protein
MQNLKAKEKGTSSKLSCVDKGDSSRGGYSVKKSFTCPQVDWIFCIEDAFSSISFRKATPWSPGQRIRRGQ